LIESDNRKQINTMIGLILKRIEDGWSKSKYQ